MKSHPRPAGETQPSEWISLETLAAEFDIAVRTGRRMIAEGEIPAYRLGKRFIRIRRADVEAALKPIPAADAS